MMQPQWPTWFYVGEVKDHDKITEAFMPYILKEKEYFHEPWTLAKCKSSCQHEKNSELPWDVWSEAVKPNFQEYMNGLQPFAPMHVDIIESWVNIYYKDGFQEIHDHSFPGRTFSCSYFFEIDTAEGARGELVFENPDYQMGSMAGLDRIFQQFKNKIFVPKVKPGTIVFFPSWVKHFTYPNMSDKRRTTFSANFSVREDSNSTMAYNPDEHKPMGTIDV
jgi:hypothetical protein